MASGVLQAIFFSEGVGPALITDENYPESLLGKTAKQRFEDYHMTYNLGKRLWGRGK